DAVMRQVAESRNGYKLSADDVVSVSVFEDKDMSVKGPIGGDGTLVLPLAGPVALAGLTAAQARQRIQEKLARYLVHPEVSLAAAISSWSPTTSFTSRRASSSL